MSRIVLALDISTQLGMAYDAPGTGGQYPAVETKILPKAIVKGAHGATFSAYRKFLIRRFTEIKPVMVVYEKPMMVVGKHKSSRKTNPETVYVLQGLAAIAEEACDDMHISCADANISTAKKHLAGHGFADKAMMMHACKIRRWEVKTDHEADACAVWSLAKSLMDPRWQPGLGPLIARELSAATGTL